ncbi:hypothetical protein ACFX13_036434 [Malus domestica]
MTRLSTLKRIRNLGNWGVGCGERQKMVLWGGAKKKSGWNGGMEVIETKGKDHIYHLSDPTCGNVVAMQKKKFSFLN